MNHPQNMVGPPMGNMGGPPVSMNGPVSMSGQPPVSMGGQPPIMGVAPINPAVELVGALLRQAAPQALRPPMGPPPGVMPGPPGFPGMNGLPMMGPGPPPGMQGHLGPPPPFGQFNNPQLNSPTNTDMPPGIPPQPQQSLEQPMQQEPTGIY